MPSLDMAFWHLRSWPLERFISSVPPDHRSQQWPQDAQRTISSECHSWHAVFQQHSFKLDALLFQGHQPPKDPLAAQV